MSGQPDVYMDTDAVRGIAKNFGSIGELMQRVNTAMEVLSNTLKATAFIGLVGGLALAHYIDVIRPQIEDIAEKCEELDRDLNASVQAYENGDQQGATRFY